MTTNDRRRIAGDKQTEFALAGEAIFTVVSRKTETRFTFKVSQAEENERQPQKPRPWFVSVLTGQDNHDDYSYLGCLWPARAEGGAPTWAHGAKSKIGKDAPSAKAWVWTWGRLATGKPVEPEAELWHEGRCCRCGRRLTVPESIEAGIGPECAKRGRPMPRPLGAVIETGRLALVAG